MIDKYLAVKDMPSAVREACVERGHGLYAEMSVKRAMSEWAAWELGDSGWGYEAAEHVFAMATQR